MSASKARGKKWTVAEDEALCVAWLNVSQDGATGTNQKLDTLYERIYEKYVEICTEKNTACNPELRAPSGLKARWLVISKGCSKFAGCLSQITNRQQSGATPADFLKQAMTLYSVSTKGSFCLLHAYKILENAPKWNQYQKTKASTIESSKRRRSEDEENYVEENADQSIISPSSSSSRPMGQKASKNQKKLQAKCELAGVEMAKAGTLLAEAAREKASLTRDRTLAINRMVNHAVMSVDFANLSETARKYFQIEQERILQQTTAEYSRPSTEHSDAGNETNGDNDNEDDNDCDEENDVLVETGDETGGDDDDEDVYDDEEIIDEYDANTNVLGYTEYVELHFDRAAYDK